MFLLIILSVFKFSTYNFCVDILPAVIVLAFILSVLREIDLNAYVVNVLATSKLPLIANVLTLKY